MSIKSALSATAIACVTVLGLLLPAAPASASVSSAFGCNGNTCIEIDGSGTTVTAIFGETTNPFTHSLKTTGTVYDNGTAIHTFPAVTLAPGGMTSQEWASPNYTFHSGDQVCVHYSGITGEPCETIG
jgi:hypothetical protein